MPAIIAKPITATPITARPLTAYGLGESTDVSRWYLHWGGVNEYAVHSAWAMSGFGDKIEFRFIADTPGTGDDYLFDSTSGENYLKITNTTAALSLGYMDIDGATQRTIAGPTIVAGTEYTGYVEFKADGVDLVVNGTTYDSANVPEIKDDFTHIAAETTPSAWFDGTIHYLRYVNATALQGVNAVQGNGVDLYGTIPTVTLTGDFEIEFWWRRKDGSSGGGSAVNILASSASSDANGMVRLGDSAAGNSVAFRIGGAYKSIGSVLDNVAQGQDVFIKLVRTGAVIEAFLHGVSKGTVAAASGSMTIGVIFSTNLPLRDNAPLYNLKITDQSGAEDVVYQYDLSGDDGDVITNVDPVTGVLGDERYSGHTSTSGAVFINGDSLEFTNAGPGVWGGNQVDFTAVAGRFYRVSFEVYDVVSCRVTPRVNFVTGPEITAAGIYEVSIGPVGASNSMRFQAQTVSSQTFKIRGVSVKESPHGLWQNYDSGVDQVALPKLSRYYKIADGPNATHLADSWGADATGAELFNVAESDWDRSKT